MKLSNTILAALTAPLASATSILLPLYLYPSVVNHSWDPVYWAAGNNTLVDFYIIVNPDSGPGATTYPNSDYTLGLSRLNSYANVHLLGYVHTSYGADASSAVTANITHWADYRNYTQAGQNISVSGIFFDEVGASDRNLNYYSQLSDFAYDTFDGATADPVVVLNPGVNVTVQSYFGLADLLVTYECTFAGGPTANDCKAYRDQTTINENTAPRHRGQSAFLIRSYTGSTAQLANSVAVAKRNGIGAFYATKALHYDDVSLLGQQAAAIGES